MDLTVKQLHPSHLLYFKKDMQEVFQQGALEYFPDLESQILPESHIDRSLETKGAIAYEALLGDDIVGGAIVVIDAETHHNHLDFLYVKNGIQGKRVGQTLWKTIESLHPDTIVWETCTPYFEKRNIHFYVNRCGFHITEFFWKHHIDPNDPDFDMPETNTDYFDGMFKFEKRMGSGL